MKKEIRKIEAKDLWNELKILIAKCRFNPYNYGSEFEENIEVNGTTLNFFAGLKVGTTAMAINGDFENAVDLFNSDGGLKWAWRILKEKGII